MRGTIFALVVGVAGLASLPATGAQAAAAPTPRVGKPVVQQVWWDRWGRWHPPYYGYRYGPPRYYAYGPPRPYRGYRRMHCLRHGWC